MGEILPETLYQKARYDYGTTSDAWGETSEKLTIENGRIDDISCILQKNEKKIFS